MNFSNFFRFQILDKGVCDLLSSSGEVEVNRVNVSKRPCFETSFVFRRFHCSASIAVQKRCCEPFIIWQLHDLWPLLSQHFGVLNNNSLVVLFHRQCRNDGLCLVLLRVLNVYTCLQIKRQRCCIRWTVWSCRQAVYFWAASDIMNLFAFFLQNTVPFETINLSRSLQK